MAQKKFMAGHCIMDLISLKLMPQESGRSNGVLHPSKDSFTLYQAGHFMNGGGNQSRIENHQPMANKLTLEIYSWVENKPKCTFSL